MLTVENAEELKLKIHKLIKYTEAEQERDAISDLYLRIDSLTEGK